ncbi:MAG: sugar-transfer associated ATP-grasp domain-containing protein [Algibacter sp.]|uniref:sugar-transfer associated ATP-grasp domain-containing protein n=1 Tax=Algibacter sp. TaxID=1872428 RepID=UPI00261261EA|nr:sugar-transfer associated ATP-grasp domain-containing protein [Algibacter sp.]MDG1730909.1 sugar-transfer associated ATP-grasp domain-containing protein [Algibacter sp.]MDG2179411.1 sugar-transfer associated ATP-grasp domain-containing protein [Algibacter sp.]
MGDATMKIPYDINSGKLYKDAYFGTWKSTKILPDSNFAFADKVLPSFDNCIAEVKRMHGNMPFARCLGWDLIVDDNNNVAFIEVNGGHNGIRFTEAVQGPCFKGLGWENLHKLN